MADRSGGTIAIRLAVRDGDQTRRMLRQFGAEGQRALDQLDQASRRPNRSMLALNDVMKDLRGTAESFAGRMGPIGSGLTAIGPAGLAVAGGLGAAAAGMVALRNASSGLADILSQASRAGLSNQVFQELSYAAVQARVSTDAVTDGIKEMQLRIDEFITTGSGSAASALKRLGFDADELAEKLQNPADLFQEIIERARRLDRAAQIRIFDEIFGGSGGEQFVRFLAEGVDSIADMRKAAVAAGVTLDDNLLKKADEIDRRFNTIAHTIGVVTKSAIVVAADALGSWVSKLMEIGKIPGLAHALAGDPMGAIEEAVAVRNEENRKRIAAAHDAVPPPATAAAEVARRIPLPTQRPDNFSELVFNAQDIAMAEARRASERASQAAARATETERQAVTDLIAELEHEQRMLGRTATERDQANALRQVGAAATEDERRRIEALIAETHRLKDAEEKRLARLDEVRDGADDALSAVRRGLESSASAGKILDDVLGGVQRRLMDLAQDQILNALFGQQSGAGGGLLSNLLGGWLGGGGGAGPGAPLNLAGFTGEYGGIYHTGGIVGGARTPRDVLITAQAGEGVFTQGQMKALGMMARGGGVTVNNYGSPDEVEVRQAPDGTTTVDIMRNLKADIASDLARGHGAIGQASRMGGSRPMLKG